MPLVIRRVIDHSDVISGAGMIRDSFLQSLKIFHCLIVLFLFERHLAEKEVGHGNSSNGFFKTVLRIGKIAVFIIQRRQMERGILIQGLALHTFPETLHRLCIIPRHSLRGHIHLAKHCKRFRILL